MQKLIRALLLLKVLHQDMIQYIVFKATKFSNLKIKVSPGTTLSLNLQFSIFKK